MKKILLISNMYPSKKEPNYGIFVANFVHSFEEKGIEFSFAVIRGSGHNLLSKWRKYTLFYFSILYRLLFCRYDLVYVHYITHAALPLRLVAKWKKIPVIFNIHGRDLLTRSRLASFFLRLSQPLLKEALMIVVPSYFFKEKVLEIIPSVSADKLFVSASGGVDTGRFLPLPSLERVYIGYVSRIDKGKGIDIFLDALEILHKKGVNFNACIIGKNVEGDYLEKTIVQKHLKEVVEYKGNLIHDDLPFYYNSMEIFIFPTSFEESLGLVGLEAMACGTPVIGSQIGGLKDYIRDGENGFLFPSGNAKALAKIIQHYFTLKEYEKGILRQNAIATAQKYRRELVAQELYNQVLNVSRNEK